jgi:hypothetical protein
MLFAFTVLLPMSYRQEVEISKLQINRVGDRRISQKILVPVIRDLVWLSALL